MDSGYESVNRRKEGEFKPFRVEKKLEATKSPSSSVVEGAVGERRTRGRGSRSPSPSPSPTGIGRGRSRGRERRDINDAGSDCSFIGSETSDSFERISNSENSNNGNSNFSSLLSAQGQNTRGGRGRGRRGGGQMPSQDNPVIIRPDDTERPIHSSSRPPFAAMPPPNPMNGLHQDPLNYAPPLPQNTYPLPPRPPPVNLMYYPPMPNHSISTENYGPPMCFPSHFSEAPSFYGPQGPRPPRSSHKRTNQHSQNWKGNKQQNAVQKSKLLTTNQNKSQRKNKNDNQSGKELTHKISSSSINKDIKSRDDKNDKDISENGPPKAKKQQNDSKKVEKVKVGVVKTPPTQGSRQALESDTTADASLSYSNATSTASLEDVTDLHPKNIPKKATKNKRKENNMNKTPTEVKLKVDNASSSTLVSDAKPQQSEQSATSDLHKPEANLNDIPVQEMAKQENEQNEKVKKKKKKPRAKKNITDGGDSAKTPDSNVIACQLDVSDDHPLQRDVTDTKNEEIKGPEPIGKILSLDGQNEPSSALVPINFGLELLESSTHNNVQLIAAGGAIVRANSVILSLNSSVFHRITTKLELEEVEMTEFSEQPIKIFLEAIYTGKLPDVPSECFRDVNKISHAFKVKWMEARCFEMFYAFSESIDSRCLDYADLLYIFEEAAFVLSKLNKREFLMVALDKIKSSLYRTDFIDQYLQQLDHREQHQLEMIIELAEVNVEMIVWPLIKQLETATSISKNTKFLLEKSDLSLFWISHPKTIDRLFEELGRVGEMSSSNDLRWAFELLNKTKRNDSST